MPVKTAHQNHWHGYGAVILHRRCRLTSKITPAELPTAHSIRISETYWKIAKLQVDTPFCLLVTASHMGVGLTLSTHQEQTAMRMTAAIV
jgi:hypothetical protein